MPSSTRTGGVIATVTATALLSLTQLTAQPQPASGPVLTVPAGFTIERVAGPPLVNRPIVADFDEEGRLYVADSSGSNDKVEKQLADDRTASCGSKTRTATAVSTRSVVFADKMMFPEGAMWFDGSLYVAAPPSIWKLTDTNGDGVADKREEWFEGKTLTGCANDLHGPYLGPDGWIYWTKGAFAEQTYERRRQAAARHARRAHLPPPSRTDRRSKSVMTGGMDNPVDVAFTPAGERILTATFLEHPQAGRRDGLMHAIYGGVYGKPHAVLDGHPRTGDLMPVMCQLGPAVPAGLTRYASRVFGARVSRQLLRGACSTCTRSRATCSSRSGATFTTRDTDFVVSDRPRLSSHRRARGCRRQPARGRHRRLVQALLPDVAARQARRARRDLPRASQRARRRSTIRVDAPALATHAPVSARPAPRRSAARRPGPRALSVLADRRRRRSRRSRLAAASSPTIEARRNAVWALTRVDDTRRARPCAWRWPIVMTAWQRPRHTPRGSGATVRRQRRFARLLTDAVGRRPACGGRSPWTDRRCHGRSGSVATQTPQTDRVLEHSLTYALIEIGDAPAVARAAAPSTRARRSVLFARDQIEGARCRRTTSCRFSTRQTKSCRTRPGGWPRDIPSGATRSPGRSACASGALMSTPTSAPGFSSGWLRSRAASPSSRCWPMW